VPVHVRSSFDHSEGTVVTSEAGMNDLEQLTVAGVAYDKNEAKLTMRGVEDQPGIVAKIFGALADKHISVDMIIQNVGASTAGGGGAATDVTFTVAKADLARAKAVIGAVGTEVGMKELRVDDDVCKVSIVGMGMRSHAGVAAKMFELLAKEGINIQAISTSEIKVSCLIASKYTELAVRALHTGFGLDKQEARTSDPNAK
jgi:aspartate kinase